MGWNTRNNTSQGSNIIEAMSDYLHKLPDDPVGGGLTIVFGYSENIRMNTTFTTFAYLGPDGFSSSLYSSMLNLPFISSALRTTNQQGLSQDVDSGFPPGQRHSWTTMTFRNDAHLILDISNKGSEVFSPYLGKIGISWTASFQPLPAIQLQQIQLKGNPQGLSVSSGDLIST